MLQAGIKTIDDELKLFVAHTLSDLVSQPTKEYIIPDALDMTVAYTIQQAIIKKYT